MPKTTKNGTAKQSELPSTLQRSPKKAQRTFAKAHDSAADEYGDEKRANQVAWAAVKHSFEKVGDHWEKKAGGKKGPSDAQAAKSGPAARKGGKTAEGVDANASKKHLYDLARRLDIAGRSSMSKEELVEAIGKENDRRSRRARCPGRRMPGPGRPTASDQACARGTPPSPTPRRPGSASPTTASRCT